MTVPSGSSADPWPIRPLLAALVDDTSLLQPRTVAPGVDAVVSRYLAARDGHYGGLVGRLVCPASQLPAVVTELARSAPSRPAERVSAHERPKWFGCAPVPPVAWAIRTPH